MAHYTPVGEKMAVLDSVGKFVFAGKSTKWINYQHSSFSHSGNLTEEDAKEIGLRIEGVYNSSEKERKKVLDIIKRFLQENKSDVSENDPVIVSWNEYRTSYALSFHLENENLLFKIAGVSHMLGT